MSGKETNRYGENKKEVRDNYVKQQLVPRTAGNAIAAATLLTATKGEPLKSVIDGSAKKDIKNFIDVFKSTDDVNIVGQAFKDGDLKRLNPALPTPTTHGGYGAMAGQLATGMTATLIATSENTRNAIRKLDGKKRSGPANKTMDFVEKNPVAFQAISQIPGFTVDTVLAGRDAISNYKANGGEAAMRSIKQNAPNLAFNATMLGAGSLISGAMVNNINRKTQKNKLHQSIRADKRELRDLARIDKKMAKRAKDYLNDAYLEKIGE